MAGSTGVHDTVVNQLLSKIDGVEQLNNILVIGKGLSAACLSFGILDILCDSTWAWVHHQQGIVMQGGIFFWYLLSLCARVQCYVNTLFIAFFVL